MTKRWFQPMETLDVELQPFVSDEGELNGIEDWQLRRGVKVADWEGAGWLACTDSRAAGPTDDVLRNHFGLPIFSSRLRRAFDASGIEGIQYLPVKAIRLGVLLPEEFYIANILNLVPALDKERSGFDVFEEDYFIPEHRGQVASVWKFALKQQALNPFDVVRLEEYSVAAFVSEVIVQIFSESHFTGWKFDPVEVFELAGEKHAG